MKFYTTNIFGAPTKILVWQSLLSKFFWGQKFQAKTYYWTTNCLDKKVFGPNTKKTFRTKFLIKYFGPTFLRTMGCSWDQSSFGLNIFRTKNLLGPLFHIPLTNPKSKFIVQDQTDDCVFIKIGFSNHPSRPATPGEFQRSKIK